MVAVEFQNVWKSFRVPHQKKRSVVENLAMALSIFRDQTYTYEDFWALRGISLAVRQGESLGILGKNGSGKSTLLRLIPGILRPTKGTIDVNGRIAPILELGVGFHPELTVTENLILFGAAIGIGSAELEKRTTNMIRFAEVERFEDSKLRSLSSGMQVRVAFSVVIQSNADIFLIDEALAVGDIGFQRKCIEAFQNFRNEGKTLVIVSHNPDHISKLCDRAILLDQGQISSDGDPAAVIGDYVKSVHG